MCLLGRIHKTSRELATDVGYWRNLQETLIDLATQDDRRAALPYLQDLTERLARVEAADRGQLPMMGECLESHRELAELCFVQKANELWWAERGESDDDFFVSARRNNFLCNAVKVSVRFGQGRQRDFYHLLVGIVHSDSLSAQAKAFVAELATPVTA